MRKALLIIMMSVSLIMIAACKLNQGEYIITFDLNGGTGIDLMTIKKGENILEPEIPVLEDHIFDGWYVDKTFTIPFSFDEEINEDITIYAKWIELVGLSYTNPVYTGGTGADPHIIRYEDAFYIYVTGGNLLKSIDMINWTDLGTVIEKPTWGTQNANIWAPDIVKIGNTFLLYYSLSTWGDPNPGVGVASALHPEGPWIDHGKLFDSEEIGVNNSIDPTVFIGQDNKVYMIWGSMRGNYGIELSSDGLSVLNGIEYANEHKVHVAGYDTSVGWSGDTYEGQYVIFKDGYYYLFLSSGSCCDGLNSNYHVRVSRSRSPLGPYIDDEGRDILSGYRGRIVVQSSSRMVGPGHNSIIIDDAGTYWMVYHAYRTDDGLTHNGRQVSIDPLIWSEDGWPYLNNLMPTYSEQEGPIFLS
jgi:arabinan endo-1,5-alpha-L-arabinosidase